MTRPATRTALTALALGIAVLNLGALAPQPAFAGGMQNQGLKNFKNAPPPKIDPKPHPKPGHHGKDQWGGYGGYGGAIVGGLALGAIAASAAVDGSECTLEKRAVQDVYGNVFLRTVRVCEE